MNDSVFPSALILLLAAAGLTGCLRQEGEITDPSPANQEAIAVRMVPVVVTDLAMPVRAAGIVALKQTVKLSFKIGGIIEALYAEEGQTVEAGRVMARLDLSETRAQADKAESAFAKAVRDLERIRSLYADQVASLEQLQNAETGMNIAESDLQVARFNLQHATIIAPSRGIILKRNAEASELVAPGVPVFVFASTEKNWIIRFGVIDRDVVRLTLGDPAEVSFDVFPDETFRAVVSEIAEAAESLTGTFEVELSVDEENGRRLVSGFIAKITVRPSKKNFFSLVPISCLVEGDGDVGYVYTVDESSSQAVKIPVKVGHILDDSVAVKNGLDTVSHVVSTGAAYLEDGARVEVKGFDPPASGWE